MVLRLVNKNLPT